MNAKAAHRKRWPLFPFLRCDNNERGSVLFYVFLAMGLLGLLTVSLVDSTRDSASTQSAQQITEKLYVQANTIRATIMGCVNTYPNAVDLDADGDIDSNDNLSPPYPLYPNDGNNPDGAGPDSRVIHVQCPGAPAGHYYLFDNSGSFDPDTRFFPPPNGFSEWFYSNVSEAGNNNVFIYTYFSTNDPILVSAKERLKNRFTDCETDEDTSGSTMYFKIYLKREGC